MKLKNKDLRILYQAKIIEKTPSSRKGCPPPSEFLHLFRKKIPEAQKTIILDHITNCGYCAQEFSFVLEATRLEKKMKTIAGDIKIAGAKPLADRGFFQGIFSARHTWRIITPVAGIIFCLILAAFVFIPSKIRTHPYRNFIVNQIELVRPKSEKTVRFPIEFEWKRKDGAEYYIVELFDKTLYLIWRSEKTDLNQMRLPIDLVQQMKKNERYFWMVTGYFPSGKKIESPLEEFSLSE